MKLNFLVVTINLDFYGVGILELLRPEWDLYFLRIAEEVSTQSDCMYLAVGAVLV